MSTYINPQKPHKTDYQDCPEIAREFLRYSQSIQGLSVRTVNAYYIDLRTFFRFLKLHRGLVSDDVAEDKINIQDIDLSFLKKINKAEVYEFTYYLSSSRDNSAAARARKLSSLKSFFRYLTSKTNQLEHNPVEDIDAPKLRQRLPKYLSLDESQELLNHITSDFYERDYCIITLFLNCGMRLSELVGINMSDVKDDTIRIIGKGNKERIVYLNDACMKAIDQLKTERAALKNVKNDDALFISKRTGRRLTARRIQQVVTECLKAAGLDGKGYSVHKLRHTAATLMYQYGQVDMLTLKEILGHENVSTTQIYTHLETVELKKAAASSPLSNVVVNKPASVAQQISDDVENNVETVENKAKNRK